MVTGSSVLVSDYVITGTGYELPNFPTSSQPQTFSTGASLLLSVTRQAVDLMEA
jgi:hypothetical protein